jgi:CO/xanthine dehydrogenase FAD-binding subunit
VVGIAVHLSLNADGSCSAAGIGVTGVSTKAFRAQGVESALTGATLDDQTIAAAAAKVCDGINPTTDLYASARLSPSPRRGPHSPRHQSRARECEVERLADYSD